LDTSVNDGERARVLASLRGSERLLSMGQAAERLGVSLRTVRRWVADGRLASVRRGRGVRISEGALGAGVGFGKCGVEVGPGGLAGCADRNNEAA
jgi:excisionase family DNA binding protein